MFDSREVVYVTSNQHKQEEIKIIEDQGKLRNGARVCKHFEVILETLPIKEVLEVDLELMVRAEVKQAYVKLQVPCIVEHAGLVFSDFQDMQYPGGLTKPMWNALGDRFVSETNSAQRSVVAQAVVAYCDGLDVHVFRGETTGKIASCPRGDREFYWDTVFMPEGDARTYAEIVEQDGLEAKVLHYSQSMKALMEFFNFRLEHGLPQELWG